MCTGDRDEVSNMPGWRLSPKAPTYGTHVRVQRPTILPVFRVRANSCQSKIFNKSCFHLYFSTKPFAVICPLTPEDVRIFLTGLLSWLSMSNLAAAGGALATAELGPLPLGDAPRANSLKGFTSFCSKLIPQDGRGTGRKETTRQQHQNSTSNTGIAAGPTCRGI